MDAIQKSLLEQVAGLHEVPEGAYNIRANGKAAARNTTASIDIVSKDGQGRHRHHHQAGDQKRVGPHPGGAERERSDGDGI